MKFNIEVDIDDLMHDMDIEDSDIAKALKQSIIFTIVNDIKADLLKEAMQDIREQIQSQVEAEVKTKIKRKVAKMIRGDKFKKRHSNSELTIDEMIKQELESIDSSGNVHQIIGRMAEKFTAELKGRYDLNFAAQVVNKMVDNNLVRKDVAELLIEE